MRLEEEFGIAIDDEQIEKIATVTDAITLVRNLVTARQRRTGLSGEGPKS